MSSKHEQTVLLVRLKRNRGVARLVKLECEPLELEYLCAVAGESGWNCEIYDGVVSREPFRRALVRLRPDIVVFSGYITAEDSIIKHAATVRRALPDAVVAVGGVHAEVNHTHFHVSQIDLVIRANALNTFGILLERGVEHARRMPGVCHADDHGAWTCSAMDCEFMCADVKPDRTHFHEHIKHFRYLDYGPTAIVKGSYGCPYKCSFCFCRLLNNGQYHARPVGELLDEIAGISAETVWIVDDSFLLDKRRVLEFCEEVRRRNIMKKFIVYGRADFIAGHPGMLPRMRDAGIIDVIVGLEAVDEAALQDYRKQVSAEANEACVRLLCEAGIRCTGLFIVSHEATRNDFRTLDAWIGRTGLRVYTLSIFTPFPGTDVYEQYKNKLTTTDCRKWDLLHLVLPPGNMGRAEFYLRFYWLQIKVLFRHYWKRSPATAAEETAAVARQVVS